ncbi:hypothetical protein D3C76_1224910 [compost metagenome]
MQTIDSGNGLNEVVFLERLVDVQHGVFRLIETGQQLVHNDQQFERVILVEALDHLLGIGLLIRAADILGPPLSHLRCRRLIDFKVAFAAVRWAHDKGAFEQTRFVQVLLVLDR